MIEHGIAEHRKQHVNLKDYAFEQDIVVRCILNQFTLQDKEVFEEILFNSLRFALEDIEENLDLTREELMVSLEKMLPMQLFALEGNELIVNKETRKLLEHHLERFEENFSPSLDFMHALLKRIPIHLLPLWYAIPKSSNNIFESLIEKYFLTPQLFERYLAQLNLDHPLMKEIIDAVLNSKSLKLPAQQLMKTHQIPLEDFEQIMLTLEYNFVLFSTFEPRGERFEHMISPLQEWKDYTLFVKNTMPEPLKQSSEIREYRSHEYAFCTDMTHVLQLAIKDPLKVSFHTDSQHFVLSDDMMGMLSKQMSDLFTLYHDEKSLIESYFSSVIQKLTQLKLALIENDQLIASKTAYEWLRLPIEKRAFSTYKHPLNQIDDRSFSTKINNERNIREIEKTLSRIVDLGWIYFDDFMQGLMAPLSDQTKVILTKEGRSWKYQIPDYSDEEKAFIEKTILEWLFESGLIKTGIHCDKICFKLTHLGESLFGG